MRLIDADKLIMALNDYALTEARMKENVQVREEYLVRYILQSRIA